MTLVALLGLLACKSPVPYEVPEGATRGLYNPRTSVTTFPDAVHLTADAATPTGLRVQLLDEARAEYELLLPDGFTLIEALEELDGFGTAGGLILQFTAPVDPTSFEQATQLWQLGADPAPLDFEVEFHRDGEMVILHPMRPLLPMTDHGLIVDDSLRDGSGARVYPSRDVHQLVYAQHQDERIAAVQDRWAELLQTAALEPDQVSAGTVWTTQSIRLHDDAVLAAITATPPTITPTGAPCDDEGTVRRCHAMLTASDFLGEDRHLDVAYGEEPVVQRTYELPVNVYLPATGPGPWPVAIYGHGLSGDRGEGSGTARRLMAPSGYAVVSIDAPSHGDHPTSTTSADLYWVFEFFGLSLTEGAFDVVTLRDAWRQAAWDKLQLAAAVRAGGLDVDGDGIADLVGNHIVYTGHSLGATMGPQLVAMDPEILAADLSVPGGRVSDIVQHGQIFAPLVGALTPEGVDDSQVAGFFPLLQACIERGDAINYAPYVLDGRRDLLLTMVLDDQIMPNRTTRALARAFDIEHAPPQHQQVGLQMLAGDLPASGNLDGRTGIFFEYDQELDGVDWVPAVHEHAHSNEVGVAQVQHFWHTFQQDDLAEVIDPYEALGL